MRTQWFADSWSGPKAWMLKRPEDAGVKPPLHHLPEFRVTFFVNPAAELGRRNFFDREPFDERSVESRCLVARLEPIFEDVVNGVGVTIDVGDNHLERAAVGLDRSFGHSRILLPENVGDVAPRVIGASRVNEGEGTKDLGAANSKSLALLRLTTSQCMAQSFSSTDPFHEVGYAGDGEEEEGEEEEKTEAGGVRLAGGIRAIAADLEEEEEEAGYYEKDQPERDGHGIRMLRQVLGILALGGEHVRWAALGGEAS
jgi:hypothetical protein